MSLNVLLLAHKNAPQVVRFIKSMSHDDVHFFVHLDKKWKLSDSDYESILHANSNVHILKNRVSVFLNHWSAIDATLQLIDLARITNRGGYFALCSGQDYPLKSTEYILNFLDKSYPKPFIDCTPYDESNWVHHKYKHTAISSIQYTIRNYYLQKVLRVFFRNVEKILPQSCTTYHQLKKFNMNFYGGSQWWILPDIIAYEILDIVRNNPELIKCYKRTLTPDETFFQTFSMMTKHANLVHINPVDQVAQSCLTYANFATPTQKFMGHPHIITADIWPWLKQQAKDRLFARKFDASVDSEIFEIIDKERNE
jgi:hypothetical protein